MKIKTTFALAITALVAAVPPAAADPGTYPPQPQSGKPDVVDRYMADVTRNRGSDALDRHLRNQPDGAAVHVDSPGVRADAGTTAGARSTGSAGGSWTDEALVVLGGGLVILLALVGSFAAHERRRPVLR